MGGVGSSAGKKFGKIHLPKQEAQLKHIFGKRLGHIPDTKENRVLLERIANNQAYFKGTDKDGTLWFSKIQPDGSQIWVRTYKGTIVNGGINVKPHKWDEETGFNKNPRKIEKKGKNDDERRNK